MDPLLRHRDREVREYMDAPDCDRERLSATYRQFAAVNRCFAGWRRTYRQRLRPVLASDPDRRWRGLDIGCGGADLAIMLARWAAADGFDLQVTGIEPDERALDYVAREVALPPAVSVRRASVEALAAAGERYDLVWNNHVLHHLPDSELQAMLVSSAQLQPRLVVFSDLRRRLSAYVAFSLLMPLFFRGSFIVVDGRISLRRSYTPAELRQAVPRGWRVTTQFPNRLLLIWEGSDA